MSEPWWPHVASFFIALSTGELLDSQTFFLLGYGFVPITIFVWSLALTDLLYEQQKKLILGLAILFGLSMESIFLYLLWTQPQYIGTVTGHFDVNYAPFMVFYQVILVIIILSNGTIFALKSLKSPNPEVRLKGKLLLAAFYSFSLGGVLDIMSPFSLITLIIARLLLFSSAFEFYGGFILPRWMRSLFLRNERD